MREKIIGYVDVFRQSSQVERLVAEVYLNKNDSDPKYFIHSLPKKIDELFGEKIRQGGDEKPFFKIECTAQIEKHGTTEYLKNIRAVKEIKDEA